LSLFFAFLLSLAQTVTAPPQNSTPIQPVNATPPKPVVEPSPDPASTHFLAPAGLVLVTIKPTATADYELAIRTLQEGLSKSTDAIKVSAAKGWRVFKASENDAKGNHLYVHVMLPAVTGFDYRPSLLLDELVKELPPDLLSKYQDAFAIPPNRLNLTEFAQMSVAPVPIAPTETKKPGQ
jgi:hypothetical protein